MGFLKVNVCTFDPIILTETKALFKLEINGHLKNVYRKLLITGMRKTYDNNIYILISNVFILAIEYCLNSEFENSTQEIRVIENLAINTEFSLTDFESLEIISFP